jgi:hypothetical protein
MDGTLNELPRGQQPNPDLRVSSCEESRTRNKKGNKSNNNYNVNCATSGDYSTATDTTPMIDPTAAAAAKILTPTT